MFDLRPVGYILGLLTVVLGLSMLFPMALDLANGDPNWQAFAISAMVAVALGGSISLASANFDFDQMNVRQAFLLTTATWVAMPLIGAMPFVLGAPEVSLTDAYFEAVSGMTTTDDGLSRSRCAAARSKFVARHLAMAGRARDRDRGADLSARDAGGGDAVLSRRRVRHAG